MKKTMITLMALAGLAMATPTDLTWVGPQNGNWFNTENWVITGTEDHPTSIPSWNTQSANNDEFIFRIGDGAKVNANNESIGYLNGKLIIGDNVQFGTNYACLFKDVEVGKTFTWLNGGDGIKFQVNSGYTYPLTDNNGNPTRFASPNTLSINSTYTGTNIISTLGTGSSIDFGTEGKLIGGPNSYSETCLGQYSAGNPRPLTLTAQIEIAFTDDAEQVGVIDRVLIEAPGIWYRDLNNVYRDDVFGLTLTSLDGTSMIKYDSVMDKDAAWTINGVETEKVLGAYRSYATNTGIGVQYFMAPEPATATLSLLALAGLMARRRRH